MPVVLSGQPSSTNKITTLGQEHVLTIDTKFQQIRSSGFKFKFKKEMQNGHHGGHLGFWMNPSNKSTCSCPDTMYHVSVF